MSCCKQNRESTVLSTPILDDHRNTALRYDEGFGGMRVSHSMEEWLLGLIVAQQGDATDCDCQPEKARQKVVG